MSSAPTTKLKKYARNADMVMTREGHLMATELWGVRVEMTEESHLSVSRLIDIDQMRKPVHLSIPAELYDIIDKTVVKDGLYRSVPEFILECTRNRLYQLRNQKIERQKLNIHFKKLGERREQTAAQASQP